MPSIPISNQASVDTAVIRSLTGSVSPGTCVYHHLPHNESQFLGGDHPRPPPVYRTRAPHVMASAAGFAEALVSGAAITHPNDAPFANITSASTALTLEYLCSDVTPGKLLLVHNLTRIYNLAISLFDGYNNTIAVMIATGRSVSLKALEVILPDLIPDT
ncbi:uncharacterized protein N7459_008380 [Penicillium hispanicum]|uniref:uncharacterized protein n=1 Tax=Penicillium hispanicum TaxID=1080232 RepID=UPI00253F9F64|nr:uncharacterized protein N7459_008380 [Penicillium hispanicum]KAJ5573953.1 hypothetical protein N7459_008380 [Penicillium hispanicum]